MNIHCWRATKKTLVLSSNPGDVTLGAALALQRRHQSQKSGCFGTDTNGGNTQMLQKRPTFLLYICISVLRLKSQCGARDFWLWVALAPDGTRRATKKTLILSSNPGEPLWVALAPEPKISGTTLALQPRRRDTNVQQWGLLYREIFAETHQTSNSAIHCLQTDNPSNSTQFLQKIHMSFNQNSQNPHFF